jgi:outer membrane immunogenic protein
VKRFLSVIFAALCLTASANAQPAAPGTWTGFYLGAHGGAAWGDQTQSLAGVPGFGAAAPINFGSDLDMGAVGGLHGGYNWQLSNAWVIGIEGDWSWSSLGQHRFQNGNVFLLAPPAFFPNNFFTMSSNVLWLASVRGRLGYSWDRYLFYVTGGVAWTEHSRSAQLKFADNSTETVNNFNTTDTGFVLGAGAEAMVARSWMLRAEYLYYDFDTARSVTAGCVGICAGVTATTFTWDDLSVHVLRLGLSYKF